VANALLRNFGERTPEFSLSAVAKGIVIGSFADDFILPHRLIMIRCLARNGARRRHTGAARRSAVIGLLSAVLCVLFSAGCTTVRKTPPPAPAVVTPAMAPAPAPEPKSPPPGSAAPAAPLPVTVQVSPPTVAPGTPSPLVELAIFIESIPPGATIVMDGRPVGKAPLHLSVPATPLGFFRDYVEIRARFIATDETEVSRTATEEFTPREKVPAVLQFTPDGAQRSVR
jgi:hypothetical protein